VTLIAIRAVRQFRRSFAFSPFSKKKIHGSSSITPFIKKTTGPSRPYIAIMRMRMHNESRLRSFYKRSESSFDAEMNEFWLGRLSDMIVRRIPKSRSMGRFRTRISVPRFDYNSAAGYVARSTSYSSTACSWPLWSLRSVFSGRRRDDDYGSPSSTTPTPATDGVEPRTLATAPL
jgi:hypothetical protein